MSTLVSGPIGYSTNMLVQSAIAPLVPTAPFPRFGGAFATGASDVVPTRPAASFPPLPGFVPTTDRSGRWDGPSPGKGH